METVGIRMDDKSAMVVCKKLSWPFDPKLHIVWTITNDIQGIGFIETHKANDMIEVMNMEGFGVFGPSFLRTCKNMMVRENVKIARFKVRDKRLQRVYQRCGLTLLTDDWMVYQCPQ